MKDYLTINEFAKLRDVNANSIRYYEKLKILMPAWIDPQTKYRYYLPEQLVLLDTITLCIKLGIPLKNLNDYIDENGGLDEKKIFEDGKKIMLEKIADMQTGLELTQFNLKALEQNQQYSDHQGIYSREIEERFLITKTFHGNWDNLIQKEKTAMDLFQYAQEQNMVPVFSAGILVNNDASPASFAFFVQVLHPVYQDSRILRLPKANYLCMQVDLTSKTDLSRILAENFPQSDNNSIIISNMQLNKLHLNSRHSEIQILQN